MYSYIYALKNLFNRVTKLVVVALFLNYMKILFKFDFYYNILKSRKARKTHIKQLMFCNRIGFKWYRKQIKALHQVLQVLIFIYLINIDIVAYLCTNVLGCMLPTGAKFTIHKHANAVIHINVVPMACLIALCSISCSVIDSAYFCLSECIAISTFIGLCLMSLLNLYSFLVPCFC